jgi:hypothetical protein
LLVTEDFLGISIIVIFYFYIYLIICFIHFYKNIYFIIIRFITKEN